MYEFSLEYNCPLIREFTEMNCVMAKFMHQLSWAIVARYVVEHFSECFCEGVLDEIES